MFLHHCDHCGRRELRGPRSLFTDDTGNFVAACRACGAVSPLLRPAAPAAVPASAATTVADAIVADASKVPSAA